MSSLPPRFNLLGVRLTGSTLDEVVGLIVRWAGERTPRTVRVFAVDPILKAVSEPALARLANDRSDLVLTDGMPLVFIGRHAAHLPIGRCYGPDVMLEVMDRGRATGVRHYLYGGTDEHTHELLRAKLLSRFPGLRIVGGRVPPMRAVALDSPWDDEDEATVRDIEASGADIVWVGIGTPKQDYWIERARSRLTAPVAIAVGAAFNFHAGTVRQAPRWMMRCGLEWLFRLCAEPRRLWRRYLLGNPRFIALVLRQWLTGRPAPLGEVYRE